MQKSRAKSPAKTQIRESDDTTPNDANLYRPWWELARLLHTRVSPKHFATKPTVIVFSGAGASKSAGLPLGNELREFLRNDFTSSSGPAGAIRQLLLDEMRDKFPNLSPDPYPKLSLFQFAALLSDFAYGRQILQRTIDQTLRTPSHRPLSYELLAHLAKHRYIDHFIGINFDTLLDESLLDEVPERLTIVAAPPDVPARAREDDSTCFLVRPFGRLGAGDYRITLDEVNSFGSEPIRRFVEDDIFQAPRDNLSTPFVMLLVGYAGAEPGFTNLMESIAKKWDRNGLMKQDRYLFTIDIAEFPLVLSSPIIEKVFLKDHLYHMRLDADSALEILLRILNHLYLSEFPTCPSAARHEIVSKICEYSRLSHDPSRFELELLLQGVKSRDFIHLESFSQIPRLRIYGKKENTVKEVVDKLILDQIIEADPWLKSHDGDDATDLGQLVQSACVPNYMIKNPEKVTARIVGDLDASRQISEWSVKVDSGGKNVIASQTYRSPVEFVRARLEEIRSAPEIEIVSGVDAEAHWTLGGEGGKFLPSIGTLADKTREILGEALTAQKTHTSAGKVTLCGIWSTGEWIFSDAGWAREMGIELLSDASIEIKVIITRSGGAGGIRPEHRKEVIKRLRACEHVEIRGLDWWKLNRRLTLLMIGGEARSAIYMRRRLFAPIVAPYFVSRGEISGTGSLQFVSEIWERYWAKAGLLKN